MSGGGGGAPPLGSRRPRPVRAWTVCSPDGRVLAHVAESRAGAATHASARRAYARASPAAAARAAFGAFWKTNRGRALATALAAAPMDLPPSTRAALDIRAAWLRAARAEAAAACSVAADGAADAARRQLDAYATAIAVQGDACYALHMLVCVVDAATARGSVRRYLVSFVPVVAPRRQELAWRVTRTTAAQRVHAAGSEPWHDAAEPPPLPCARLHDAWSILTA